MSDGSTQIRKLYPLVIRSGLLVSLAMSQLLAIAPGFAQSTASDRIDCIKKFRDFYYSSEGGLLNSRDALAKAEQTCAEESRRNTVPPNPGPVNNPGWSGQAGGSPTAIAACMKKLMYERKLVCTRTGFPSCSSIPHEGFAGWEMQDVRTEISETAAVQACQNAR